MKIMGMTLFLVLTGSVSFSKVLIDIPKIESEVINVQSKDVDKYEERSNQVIQEFYLRTPQNEKLINSEHSQNSHEKIKSVSADQSLQWLKNGNIRYLKGFLRNDGISKTDRKRLESGQAPHAIVYSCSDSRVPAEIIFDQKLGEIFGIRSAGQAIDQVQIASIEYALEHLGSKLIVVMGHTSCGAVKAAYHTKPDEDAGSPALNFLVKDIQPRIQEITVNGHSENFEKEAWINAQKITAELSKRSEIIKKHLDSGKVKIVPALYHLDSGVVSWE